VRYAPLGTRLTHAGGSSLLALSLWSCGPQDDLVFRVHTFELVDDSLSVREGAGATSVTLRLAAPANRAISASYQVEKLEAQDDCQVPDFELASGRITWRAGETDADIELYVGDDDLAETDERLQITLAADAGDAPRLAPDSALVVIRDDDRSGIVDARADYGVEPGQSDDQAPSLQAALDRAAALGRGLVLLAPGDYQISHLSIAPGTTLSGRGARLHRPPMSPADTVAIDLAYAGAADSAATLIEGLAFDGQRDLQGPYQNSELVDTHFVKIAGSSEEPGRVRATIEGLTASDGAASAVFVGPSAEVDACHLAASNMWRDAFTLRGGGSSVRLRALDAVASDGTTGIWLGGNPAGYQGTRRIDAEVEDARLGTGDVEIEALDGVLRRLSMTEAPLRLLAPASTVRIIDSVLVSGVPSAVHNFWDSPDDVEVTGTTLIASESSDDSVSLTEQDRGLAAATVRFSYAPASAASHLLFDHCRFERAADVEDTDMVYGIDSPALGGAVEIRASTLGAGVRDWFAPGCQNCGVEP
jgi:hypothetical protein